jgi:hypothetical protein
VASLPYNVLTVNDFGGLNVAADAQDVGWSAAVDLLNVTRWVPGRISTRSGYAKLNTSTPSGAYTNAVETRAGGTAHIAAFRTTKVVDSIASTGVVTAAAASFPAGFTAFQTTEFGSPSGTLLYIADTGAATAHTLQKWNGATLANSVGKPQFVAVTPWDNRVAQAGYAAAADTPSGANGSTSTVFFSDALAPDTYTSTSWVELHPGDGEVITAMVAWHDLLFVFKETACFVFYGTATLSDGTPQFLYRRVTLPSSIATYANTLTASVNAATAGPGGVYYHAADGIYITTGGTPVMASGDVRGIFSGTAISSQTRSGNSGSAYPFHLSAIGERVYFSYMNTDASPRALVFDRPTGTWTLWSIPAIASPMPIFGAGFRSNSRTRTPYVIDDATADVYEYSDTATTDDGTTISWLYQSGYYAPPPADGRRAKLRGSSVWGYSTNAPTLQILTEGGRTNDVADTGSTVTLGTSPTVAEGKRRHSARGVLFAHKLSGTGPATITRLTHRFLPPGLDS